ncbi:Brp/Blh family beta-carotene 15,15'-dioxygenase [Gaetbulibacter aestuarii]|uniref:Probable beta-carotene 15,15'-dioxygenase n=1 Tax=Gaetbulibacter aestuarii TaxID=1502358 RepID=A0ABW7N0Y5_9FLAO
MTNFYNIAIVLSFVGLWINAILPQNLEIILGFLLIFSFGILHGSNDILILDTIENKKSQFPFLKILITYVITVLIVVVVFYMLPSFALLLFILFSGFHFGQQHWEHKDLNVSMVVKNMFYAIYGLLVLNLLFVCQSKDVINIVDIITGQKITVTLIQYTFIVNTILLITAAGYLLLKNSDLKSQLLAEVFYLLLFAIIFKVGTLIWSFAIYFIFWHSIPSLLEQIQFIYGNISKKSIWDYCKKALPYWLVSLTGMAVLVYLFEDTALFYALFFSFIAAVTFPHTIVINKLFMNKKTQPE